MRRERSLLCECGLFFLSLRARLAGLVQSGLFSVNIPNTDRFYEHKDSYLKIHNRHLDSVPKG